MSAAANSAPGVAPPPLTPADRINARKIAERFAWRTFERPGPEDPPRPWLVGEELHVTQPMLVNLLEEVAATARDAGQLALGEAVVLSLRNLLETMREGQTLALWKDDPVGCLRAVIATIEARHVRGEREPDVKGIARAAKAGAT